MAKKVVQIDYEKIFGPEFLNILMRVENLEDEQNKLHRDEEMKILSWDSDISSAKREIRRLKEKTEETKNKISMLKQTFLNLVTEFKIRANEEEFDKLKRKVDSFDIEKLLTRREFEKMLKD